MAYREKLAEHSAIWGDLYALTMSQAFYENEKHDLNTTFHAYIRKNPFNGGYLVTGGQNIIFEWLEKHWKFDEDDLELLRNKKVVNPDTGKMERLFTDEFVDMLRDSKLELTIEAMPEGELAFPDEPIYRVHGPLWQCLMVEAAILNVTNSQSLFATLASRLKEVADGGPVLEFGLRRAQAIGGLEPTRGAFVGGIDGSSNVLAEKYYGIETAGTMAHALIMTYEDELEAFEEYAKAMPYNGIFLVDTYDTVEGVKKAIEACKKTGAKLKGIRLDSGDMAYLSKEARKVLDEAGYTEAKIAASNDLDEEEIVKLKNKGCKIDIWAVGTNLVTSKQQPALGAVYKLGAVFDGDLSQEEIDGIRQLARKGISPQSEQFKKDRIKLSAETVKVTIPGELDVLRYVFTDSAGAHRFDGDTIISNFMESPLNENANPGAAFPGALTRDVISVRKDDDTLTKVFHENTTAYRPLLPAFKQGQRVAPYETVHEARDRAARQLSMLEKDHRSLSDPRRYVVGVEEGLFDHRQQMIRNIRRKHNLM